MPRLPLILPDAAPPPRVPVFRRQGFTRQPNGPVHINWANPLTRDLVLAHHYVPWERNRDIAGVLPNLGWSLTGTPTFQRKKGLAGYGGFSSGSYIKIPDNLAAVTGNPRTAMVVACNTTGGNQGFGETGTGGSAEHAPHSNSVLVSLGSATRVGGATSTFDITSPWAICVSYYLPGAGNKAGYTTRNVGKRSGGNFVSYPTATAAVGDWIGSNANLGYSFGYGAYGGIFAALFVWDRALSNLEREMIIANPWQIFA